MSVQSLNNGQLQLSELVISNEKYTSATGYVASTATFSSSVNGTSLTTPQLSLTNGANTVALTPSTSASANFLNVPNLNISGVKITFGSAANTPAIENISNSLNIYSGGGGSSNNITLHAGGITLNTPTGTVNLTISTAGALSVPSFQCTGLQDSGGSYGTAGQVPIATGAGQWVWGTPT